MLNKEQIIFKKSQPFGCWLQCCTHLVKICEAKYLGFFPVVNEGEIKFNESLNKYIENRYKDKM